MGQRPAIKVRVKSKESGTTFYVLAAWEDERGRLSGRLEEGWTLVSPEGHKITTGREGNAFLDVYDNRGENGPPRRDTRGAPEHRGGGGFSGGDDFGDEDIPF